MTVENPILSKLIAIIIIIFSVQMVKKKFNCICASNIWGHYQQVRRIIIIIDDCGGTNNIINNEVSPRIKDSKIFVSLCGNHHQQYMTNTMHEFLELLIKKININKNIDSSDIECLSLDMFVLFKEMH